MSFALLFCVVVFILVFGDRVFLVFIGAREVERANNHLYNRLQNLSCLKEVKKIRLYKTFYLPANVYILHPYFGTPAVVFSKDFFDRTDEEMINLILERAVLSVKDKKTRFSNLISQLQFVALTPKFIADRLGLEALGVAYFYFLLPIEYLKNKVVRLSFQVPESTNNLGSHQRISYYLEKFPEKKCSPSVELAKDFVLYRREEDNLWNVLLGNKAMAKKSRRGVIGENERQKHKIH